MVEKQDKNLRHRRSAVSIVDRSLVAGASLLFVVFVSRNSTPAELGKFSVAYSFLVLALGLAAVVVAEAFSLRWPDPREAKYWLRPMLGAMALWGVALAPLILILGAAYGGIDPPIALLAFSSPTVLFVEGARRHLTLSSSPSSALVLDLSWILPFGISVVLVNNATGVALVWVASSWIGALVAALVWSLRPALAEVRPLMRELAPIGKSLGQEQFFPALIAQLTVMGVAAFGGLATAGALRVAQTVAGPIAVVFAALRVSLLPQYSQSRPTLKSELVESCVYMLLGLGYGIGALAVLAEVGDQLFGETWPDAESATVIALLTSAVGLLASVPLVRARVFGQARILVRLRLIAAMVGGAVSVALAPEYGATGAVLGTALTTVIVVVGAWGMRKWN